VQIDLNQDQFDALVDFCFNTGRGNFLKSSLLRYVNGGEFQSAIVQFGLWVHAAGEVVPGLVRRRAAEAALFEGRGFQPERGAVSTASHCLTGNVEPALPLPSAGNSRIA
jgi:hypothetical protein